MLHLNDFNCILKQADTVPKQGDISAYRWIPGKLQKNQLPVNLTKEIPIMHPSRKEQTPRKKMGGRRKRGYGGGDDLSLFFHRIHPFRRRQSRRVIPFPLSTFAFGTMYDQSGHHTALGTSSALGYLCQFPPFLEERPCEMFSRDNDLALFVGRSHCAFFFGLTLDEIGHPIRSYQ